MNQEYWIGVDIGGTFSDIVLLERVSGELTVHKSPSTPEAPEQGAVRGIRELLERVGVTGDQVRRVVHGTTVATNAVLERNGARTALLVTDGFRDLLEIRRQDRPDLYNFRVQKPEPLVPRERVFAVDERMQYDGTPLRAVSLDRLSETAQGLSEAGMEAVAVCLLHSYRNGEHERQVREELVAQDSSLTVVLSHEVAPEIKEYERASTTAVTAYVSPVIERYLTKLNHGLAEIGINTRATIMQSSGGIMSSEQASSRAGETLISGPAAGVLAGVAFSPSDTFITADMGGTSFDVALVEGGAPRITLEGEVATFNVRLPRIDVNTIGAGGGSIAWIDAGGALRVGPRSAGAVPGPACYRRGGKRPTVTDAHAVLGRINPNYMLGGDMQLDVSVAWTAVEQEIAMPLGLSVEEAAQGVLDVVNATMVKGIRKVSVERGHDPREFDLISFGGAGPLHAIELAAELGMRRVVIPYHPGVNSALGLLAADYRYTKVRSLLVPFSPEQAAHINEALGQLRSQAEIELGTEGFSEKQITYEHHLYLRYSGQGSELEIPLKGGHLGRSEVDELLEEFARKHVQEFGYKRDGEPVELVNARVTATTESGIRSLAGEAVLNREAHAETTRGVFLSGVKKNCAIYERERLPEGARLAGPAIIEQLDSTTVVPPGYTVEIDSQLNLIARNDTNG